MKSRIYPEIEFLLFVRRHCGYLNRTRKVLQKFLTPLLVTSNLQNNTPIFKDLSTTDQKLFYLASVLNQQFMS